MEARETVVLAQTEKIRDVKDTLWDYAACMLLHCMALYLFILCI